MFNVWHLSVFIHRYYPLLTPRWETMRWRRTQWELCDKTVITELWGMITTCYIRLQELRESVQLLLTTKIAVYLMTFLIVTVAWAAHIRWVTTVITTPHHFYYREGAADALRWLPSCSSLGGEFRRLFQVIVRIDDCLALLNLVSITVCLITSLKNKKGFMEISLQSCLNLLIASQIYNLYNLIGCGCCVC